ncbi:MAG TPA: FAD binding domain-containing protein [Vicinamibacteria bacterium]|nr:FAD binding domain-containing protein [Vicinamibacteria bacterium]
MSELIEVALSVNRQQVKLRVPVGARLLDLLRDQLRLTGAKEGCGKGECGACSVILDGKLVASCLVMAYQADGSVVETVEGLAQGDRLHPLQEAFIEKGAVQCGACIPGMVMAGKALLEATPNPSPQEIRSGLAGNLCRCTGYAKIFDAVQAAVGLPRRAAVGVAPPPATPPYFRPRSLEEALEVLIQRAGEVRPVAGGTDLLVKAKDGLVDPSALFDLSLVPELQGIEERNAFLRLGAATTHAQLAASPLVARYVPALAQACALIGGPQIRNQGTLGGNLANGSPAADTAPPLYVSDALVEVVSVSSRREVPIAEFFTGPRQTVLTPDELIVAVRVPKRPGVRAAFVRLGQRQAQAISKVSVAVAMTFADGKPDWVRVALGAVAPTPIRAREAEKALLAGGPEALRAAREMVQAEVKPISDLRSTSAYRRVMAGVLLERAIRKLVES